MCGHEWTNAGGTKTRYLAVSALKTVSKCRAFRKVGPVTQVIERIFPVRNDGSTFTVTTDAVAGFCPLPTRWAAYKRCAAWRYSPEPERRRIGGRAFKAVLVIRNQPENEIVF